MENIINTGQIVLMLEEKNEKSQIANFHKQFMCVCKNMLCLGNNLNMENWLW